jgi:CRP/FNR family cyclic AMP-dependent transcriptional regulator
VKFFFESAGLGRSMAKFRGKEIVFSQGDRAGNVIYIHEAVSSFPWWMRAAKKPLWRFWDLVIFLVRAAFAGQAMCMATATAIAPTTVLIIEKGEMIRALHEEHEFSDRFITYLLARNVRGEADLIDQLYNSSEKRLARTLLLLARYGAPGHLKRCSPKYSRRCWPRW